MRTTKKNTSKLAVSFFPLIIFTQKTMQHFSIAIHGGAGTLTRGMMTAEKESAYLKGLQEALNAGYSLLAEGASATEAVVAAVASLEDCPLFNAGKGSVFTADGTHEMDAAIMEGTGRNAGAVAMVTGIKNPIRLAQEVMLHSNHVLLAGEGAMAFAKQRNFETLPPSYFFNQFRFDQWQEIKGSDRTQLDHTQSDHKFGTVGAVACDQNGAIAAATSTGGMTNKKFGRIGDSPLIGSGTYANNATCAVSCTGSGEYFIRGAVAYDVACFVEHLGVDLQSACNEVIQKRLLDLGGDGGLIAINREGMVSFSFNTEGMYRGYRKSDGTSYTAIYRD